MGLAAEKMEANQVGSYPRGKNFLKMMMTSIMTRDEPNGGE